MGIRIDIYILHYVNDSYWEGCCINRELSSVICDNINGKMRRWGWGKGVQEKRELCVHSGELSYFYSWFSKLPSFCCICVREPLRHKLRSLLLEMTMKAFITVIPLRASALCFLNFWGE